MTRPGNAAPKMYRLRRLLLIAIKIDIVVSKKDFLLSEVA